MNVEIKGFWILIAHKYLQLLQTQHFQSGKGRGHLSRAAILPTEKLIMANIMWKKIAFSSPDCAFYISLSTVRPSKNDQIEYEIYVL